MKVSNFFKMAVCAAIVSFAVGCNSKSTADSGANEAVDSVKIELQDAVVEKTVTNQVATEEPSKLLYSPSANEIKANTRYIFEEFSESGIIVGFDFGIKNQQTLVFLVSNDNDFACKVAIQYSTEDGKTSTVETKVNPKEKKKEIDPKVNENYPVNSWSVKEISQIN
ncbi:MAG: hypothetical protein LBR34_05280 [Prevotella sp.]|jgi:hypothetical protein|nr:hypothetical protein [Prevotella sp.]